MYSEGSALSVPSFYIAMGPQMTVHIIIKVSLFQSAHNSRFDCISFTERYMDSCACSNNIIAPNFNDR